MELDIGAGVNQKELEAAATRFRLNLGAQLTEDLQHYLNDVLGSDVRVGVRVIVESVSLRKLTDQGTT